MSFPMFLAMTVYYALAAFMVLVICLCFVVLAVLGGRDLYLWISNLNNIYRR